jgi:hypothetical protein
MSVVMKKNQKTVLPFPKRLEEPAPSTIIVRIGSERFAIHWTTEDLPPAPLVLWKRGADKKTAES